MLYFDFIKAITEAKIDLSSSENAKINMDFFNNPFSVDITQDKFNSVTENELEKIKEAMCDTLKIANIDKKDIDKVFLTGGTTLIPSVKKIFEDSFESNKLIQSDVFSSVGYGLTLYNQG